MTVRDPAITADDPAISQAGRSQDAFVREPGASDAVSDAVDQGAGAPLVPQDGPQDASSRAAMPYSASDFRREITRMKRRRVINVVIGVVVAVLVVLAVVAVAVFKIPSSLQTVNSDGMTPVLLKGQVVLTKEIAGPTVGEVIAFKDANGAVSFRRVVALAGEWVNVASDGTIAVSDTALEGDAAINGLNGGASIIATRQVPDGACFVIADTDASAIEELYKTDNYISNNQIIGRADYRVWPLTNLGPVN